MKLYPFQEDGVRYALDHHYTINGCEMGLGKTAQAISVMEKLQRSTLVVCPAYLRLNWLSEIAKFATTLDCESFDVISYHKFTREAVDYTDAKLVIFDEAHYLKNMSTQRTDVAHRFIKKIKPIHLMLLTGTPILNRVTEFYSLLKLCSNNPRATNGEKISKGLRHFSRMLCYEENIHTSSGFMVKKYHGLKNKALLQKYLHRKYFRRLAKDELCLPELRHSNIYSDVTPSKSEEDQLTEAFNSSNQGHISIAKAKNALFKTTTTLKYVKDLLDQELDSLIIFTDHVLAAKKMYDTLKLKNTTALVDGSVEPQVRNQIVRNFQEGSLSIIVATLGSMSTGFNLKKSRHIIFNDHSWVPAINLQAIARIYRIGQTRSALISRIICPGIDFVIQKSLDEKMEVLKNAT